MVPPLATVTCAASILSEPPRDNKPPLLTAMPPEPKPPSVLQASVPEIEVVLAAAPR